MAQPTYEPVRAAPPYESVAPTPQRTWGWGSLAARLALTLVGAGGLVIGGLMDWFQGTKGTDLGVRSLWRTTFTPSSSSLVPTVGFVMIVLGLLAIVGLAPRSGGLTRLAGALGIAAVVLFLIEAYRGNAALKDLDVGVWVALAGSVIAVIGGFLGTRTAVFAWPPVRPPRGQRDDPSSKGPDRS